MSTTTFLVERSHSRTTAGLRCSTMNTHPLHFDEEYAATTEFGRPLDRQPANGGGGSWYERV